MFLNALNYESDSFFNALKMINDLGKVVNALSLIDEIIYVLLETNNNVLINDMSKKYIDITW